MLASTPHCALQEMDGMPENNAQSYEQNEESCRMMTKRRNPFGESTYRNMKMQVLDPQEVKYTQERTLRALMQAGKGHQQPQTGALPGSSYFSNKRVAKCWVCSTSSEVAGCSFCEHEACKRCLRPCDKCMDTFCSVCSAVDFSAKYERILCLTCRDEELKARRSPPSGLRGAWSHQYPRSSISYP